MCPKSLEAVPEYDIEFYEDESGNEPVVRWLTEELDYPIGSIVGLAMKHILQTQGAGVTETRYGKALGSGLYEFRLDTTLDELLKHLGLAKTKKLADAPSHRMMFRIFFHVYGEKIILLLGAYDKGSDVSSKRQEKEIGVARARLAAWEESRKRAEKQARKAQRSRSA